MKGYEFTTNLVAEFKKKGTASYKVVFLDDRRKFTVLDIETDHESKETRVLLLDEGK